MPPTGLSSGMFANATRESSPARGRTATRGNQHGRQSNKSKSNSQTRTSARDMLAQGGMRIILDPCERCVKAQTACTPAQNFGVCAHCKRLRLRCSRVPLQPGGHPIRSHQLPINEYLTALREQKIGFKMLRFMSPENGSVAEEAEVPAPRGRKRQRSPESSSQPDAEEEGIGNRTRSQIRAVTQLPRGRRASPIVNTSPTKARPDTLSRSGASEKRRAPGFTHPPPRDPPQRRRDASLTRTTQPSATKKKRLPATTRTGSVPIVLIPSGASRKPSGLGLPSPQSDAGHSATDIDDLDQPPDPGPPSRSVGRPAQVQRLVPDPPRAVPSGAPTAQDMRRLSQSIETLTLSVEDMREALVARGEQAMRVGNDMTVAGLCRRLDDFLDRLDLVQ
ncbi:hypothetical protein FA95DRAFT_1681154 [Auriscalpium vulgare]|uniref:Uncharacterized protein n=1 Tax=Auriscalpium vulgare TaxID=40419 RepID=A0ACB8RKB9_9AGAM|nr:hypothetical protein FA95DRAFT_1681154 [Auriscalpium vulgare]